MVHRINTAQDVASMRADALAAGLNDQEVTAYFVFCSGFYGNMGNYKGFGDSKFVPNLTKDKFEALVKISEAFKTDGSGIGSLWKKVKDAMYSLSTTVSWW